MPLDFLALFYHLSEDKEAENQEELQVTINLLAHTRNHFICTISAAKSSSKGLCCTFEATRTWEEQKKAGIRSYPVLIIPADPTITSAMGQQLKYITPPDKWGVKGSIPHFWSIFSWWLLSPLIPRYFRVDFTALQILPWWNYGGNSHGNVSGKLGNATQNPHQWLLHLLTLHPELPITSLTAPWKVRCEQELIQAGISPRSEPCSPRTTEIALKKAFGAQQSQSQGL